MSGFLQQHSSIRLLIALFATICFVVLGAAQPLASLFLLVAFGLVLACFFFEDRTNLWILGFLFPFQGIRLVLPAFHDATLLSFFPDGIDQSLGNVVALCIGVAFGLRWLIDWARGTVRSLSWPLFGTILFFWLSAFLSTINAEEHRLLSLKYALYPIVFSYLAYVFLPAQLVRAKEDFFALIRGMTVAGVVTAVMGIASLFLGEVIGFRRVAPLPLFGIWPLGTNHNLLAETLVATVPLLIILALQQTHRGRKRLMFFVAGGMAIVALLTFARTAWIAFSLMGTAAFVFFSETTIRRTWRQVVVACMLLLPLIAVLLLTVLSRVEQGSTASRLAMTQFASFLFWTHPVFGAGAGTFVERLGGNRDFLQDFGDPLDAHGLGQKVFAEQGVVGALGIGFFFLRLALLAWRRLKATTSAEDTQVLLLCSLSAFGMIAYELFNTTYYSAKLWLPIGVLLVAVPLCSKKKVPVL
jgi:hypothetical protein